MVTTLDKQPIRAVIQIGKGSISSITVQTPNITSFRVTRSRGQASATFSASVKVDNDEAKNLENIADSKIEIKAGASRSFTSGLNTIFTGIIYKCIVNPVRTDASKVMLNLTGKDNLSILEGQKINRRLVTSRSGDDPPQRWGIVSNIVKQHTPIRQRFPVKVYQKDAVVVNDWEGEYNIFTPDAFRLDSNPVRKRDNVLRGLLTAEQSAVTEEEE